MKKIVLFCVLMLMVSCDSIQYDGKVRLVITGQIVDKNNNPIPDAPIDVVAYREESNASDLISYGSTDASGNFLLIIPAPKGSEDLIEVIINENDQTRQKKIYRSIKQKDFNEYKLILPKTILYANTDLSKLEIQTRQNNPNKNISELRLTSGFEADEIVAYNPQPDDLTGIYSFLVLKNQSVTISYKLTEYNNGTIVTTEHTETIAISDQSNVSHTINY